MDFLRFVWEIIKSMKLYNKNMSMENKANGKDEAVRRWSPRDLWIPAMTWMIGMMIVKLLVFDVLWHVATSWSSFFRVGECAYAILLAFVLCLPMGMFRRKWLQVALSLVTDVVLFALLCYQGGGVTRLSLMGCLLLLLTTLVAVVASLRYPGRKPVPVPGKMQYAGYLLAWSFIAWLLT